MRKKLLSESQNKQLRWERYVTSLYNDDSRDQTMDFERQLSGKPTLREDVECHEMKLGEARGEDGIATEFEVKIWDLVIDFLVVFFKKIYKEGEFPGEFRKSTFNYVPKKLRAQECTDFKNIALMSHVTKVLAKNLFDSSERVEKRTK